MVGKYQTILAGDEPLQVVNIRLSLTTSSGQFSIITPTPDLNDGLPWRGGVATGPYSIVSGAREEPKAAAVAPRESIYGIGIHCRRLF
jgi:hypothetical protein